MASVSEDNVLDLDGEPPTNADGEFICGRRCVDETRCMAPVSLQSMACYQHDRSDPIVADESASPE